VLKWGLEIVCAWGWGWGKDWGEEVVEVGKMRTELSWKPVVNWEALGEMANAVIL
jgi:hypothetical protein